jgi:hypothetical protein
MGWIVLVAIGVIFVASYIHDGSAGLFINLVFFAGGVLATIHGLGAGSALWLIPGLFGAGIGGFNAYDAIWKGNTFRNQVNQSFALDALDDSDDQEE